MMECANCGWGASDAMVAIFDYCPRCKVTPFPDKAELAAPDPISVANDKQDAYYRTHERYDDAGTGQENDPDADPAPWRCVDFRWTTNHVPLGAPCRSATSSWHNCQYDPRTAAQIESESKK